MFADADYPAVPYPGSRPAASFVHMDGRGLALAPDPAALSGWRVGGRDLDAWLAERSCPPLAERVPLLSYGSNACPAKLTWLRAAHGLGGPVVVLRARCSGLSAVWAAGLRVVDDQRPAVLAAAPGVVEDHALIMAAADQLAAFDTGEGRGDRYHLAAVTTGVVSTEDGAAWDRVLAYVGAREIRRPLLVGGSVVACSAVPQEDAVHLAGTAADDDGLAACPVSGSPDPREFPGALFVYGTLQPGAAAWHRLAPHAAGPARPASLPGTLYDTGQGYPALLRGAGVVQGWVVPLRTGAALAELDDYEGPEYARVRVATTDGAMTWTYIWLRPVAGLRPLGGPWRR